MNRFVVFALLLGTLVLPGAQAQGGAQQALYSFDMNPLTVTTQGITPGGGEVRFTMEILDHSRDSTGGLAQNPAVPNYSPQGHQIRFGYDLHSERPIGWAVQTPSILTSFGGQRHEVDFVVTTSLLIQEHAMPITLFGETRQAGVLHRMQVNVTLFSLGVLSFSAQPEDLGGEVKPDSIVDIPVRITNGALVPRGFDIRVTNNPCGMQTATGGNNLVGARETKVYTVSVRTPGERPWYFSQNCELGITIAPTDTPTAAKSLTATVVVNGGYIDPAWVFRTVAILLVIVIIVFFVARRKARIEEEILGKPQKPWTIPVEVLYLRALREKDERAWYVVRHHLMEEEYRSSLLWYAAYKKATKGSRKKEALVLRQEKAYERWKAAWAKDIAKPVTKADRFEAKLQRKLDRKARKQDRKDARKVRRITKKMAAAHGKQVERALEKWQRETRKAEKKGLELPKRPVLAEPDYPEEPEPRSVALADHKWNRKAERFRARMLRKQGDLEVKFEKADARQLAKLRRKVQRVARKLDDPDFVAEHPLLNPDGA